MKIRRDKCASQLPTRLVPIAASFLATLLALPVQAATSFPDYPLQAGLGGVPPNILFVLDDSGSMDYLEMPQDDSSLGDNPSDRSYLNNTIYYDPSKPYYAWRTGEGTDRLTGGTSVTSVYSDTAQLEGSRDLRDSEESVFYVPKPGVTDSTDEDDFDRYQIRTVGGSARVMRGSGDTLNVADDSWDNRDIGSGDWWRGTFTVPEGATSVRFRARNGSGRWSDADLYVRYGAAPTTNTYDRRSVGSGNDESITIDDPQAGVWHIGVFNSGSNRLDNEDIDVDAYRLDLVEATPTGRTQAAELLNFATWYSYHRSRMKTAKAGASEAFAELGTGYRVGFDTIWNRGGSGGNASGSTPNFPIPVGTDAGKFDGANRRTWFSRLQSATANSGTPLHGALARAGRYYQKSAPWTDGPGTSELACRASFTILTTDGYWNDDTGFDDDDDAGSGVDAEGRGIASGNADGDAWSRTLADVAMNYYRKDLRPSLPNQVPTTTADQARHQHMVTFGVSIGKGGTLDPTQQPPARWPDPWDYNRWGDGTLNQQQKRIDDLWHAAVNTKGKFIVASDSESFADALRSALTAIEDRKASGSNISSNGQQITSSTRMYQAMFNTGDWSGDLRAYAFDVGSGSLAADPVWSLIESVNADDDFVDRTVLTWNAGGKTFTASNLADSDLLERDEGLAPVSADDNIAYIKGVRSLETQQGDGKLRDRRSPIGDIVNSSPIFVNETQTLYIGANDGMLHAVNASDGEVLFSYVPAGVDFEALGNLSNPDYEHRFFVDGQLDVTTRGHGQGSNILVGTLGRGGKGAFALNVTDPAGMSESGVLWDQTFQTGGDNDMGYVLGAPIVRKSNDGRTGTDGGNTIALVPNGIESASGRAVLFVYVLGDDGTIIDTIKLYGGAQSGNGLMAVNAADLDANGTIDTVYGGDLQGNVWKWDFTATNRVSWSNAVPGNLPLFTATDSGGTAQPITGGFALAREPGTRRIFVSFGTGKFIADSDIPGESGSIQTQTLYGVIDDNEHISGRSELQERTIPYVGIDSKGRSARSFEDYSPLPDTAKGWYVDLGVPATTARGERVVTSPVVNGRALWVSSIIPLPGEGCEPQGSGYLNALDVFTGTNPADNNDRSFTFIDVDNNGQGDDKVNTGTGSSPTVPGGDEGFVTSVDLGVGMPGKPMVGDIKVCVSGSDATSDCVSPTPGPGGAAGRVMWRELINR